MLSSRRWRSIRRTVLSTNLLRFINVILILFLLIEVRHIYQIFDEWKIYFDISRIQSQRLLSKSNPIRWMDIDILQPPALANGIIEALRINELLANGKSADLCSKITQIGSRTDGFLICEDEQFALPNTSQDNQVSVRALLIKNHDEKKSGNIESLLKINRWNLFIPARSTILEEFNADVEIHYLPTIPGKQNEYEISVSNILADIRKMDFAVAKIDLLDNKEYQIYTILNQLLVSLNANQLLAIIRIRQRDARLLYNWYNALYTIYYRSKFVIFTAESSGACGADLEIFANCEYRITFLNKEKIKHRNILAPVFGLGSPMEEKYRLINYLMKSQINECINYDEISLGCKTNRSIENKNDDKCMSLVYFRYRNLANQDEWNRISSALYSMCTQINIFYPYRINSDISIPPIIKNFAFGISANNESKTFPINMLNKSDYWNFEPFDKLINRLLLRPYTSNILIFDLDGGEWIILDGILQAARIDERVCSRLRNFKRIIMRVRIWMVEEAQNFRRFYSNFLLLERECEFVITHAVMYNISTFGVVFQRKNIFNFK